MSTCPKCSGTTCRPHPPLTSTVSKNADADALSHRPFLFCEKRGKRAFWGYLQEADNKHIRGTLFFSSFSQLNTCEGRVWITGYGRVGWGDFFCIGNMHIRPPSQSWHVLAVAVALQALPCAAAMTHPPTLPVALFEAGKVGGVAICVGWNREVPRNPRIVWRRLRLL